MKWLLIFISFFAFILLYRPATALECEGNPPSGNADEIQEYIKYCEDKINSLQQKQNTLKSAINVLNTKIKLAQAQINRTKTQINTLEQEIDVLSEVVNVLSSSQGDLLDVYAAKVKAYYKATHADRINLIFSSKNFADFYSKIKYLQIARSNDKRIIYGLEQARLDYNQRKQLKTKKQQDLEKLQQTLQGQRASLNAAALNKKTLLNETQNSEAKYQLLLAKAVAELRAIESIIAGLGSEVASGDVKQGDKIASIIPGASACSTGGHLHLEVVKNKAHQNPANFLKNQDVIWNNQPDGPFDFTGSWDWPLNSPVRITQGYGHTAYSARYANNQHTGIDMVSSNPSVKAIRSGKLYRGSIACGGGTLKYVRVDHDDSDYDTYYLHVNYF